MKKQSLHLIINAVILLLLGLIVIFVINLSVTQNPEDLLFNQMVDLVDETNIENPSGTAYQIVDYKATAVSNNGTIVGTVYNVKIRNAYELSSSDRGYGYIELLVGIKDDKVSVSIVTLEQSISYIAGIQKYIYEYYDHIPYMSVLSVPDYNAAPAADLESGATASTSTDTIRSIIWTAVQIHYSLAENDPLVDYLGEEYILEHDITFAATEHISLKQNIISSTIVPGGYIYTVTDEGEYEGYEGTHTGSITLLVIFNESHEIVAIYMPEDLYGQTLGFKSNNDDYLEMFYGKTLSEISTIITDNADLHTGATYSKNLISSILESLVSEVA